MSDNKISVALICGGQSPEHEISIMSAQNVFNAIDSTTFDRQLIYIDKTGHWFHSKDLTFKNLTELTISPGNKKQAFHPLYIDIAFPILHGQLGEDGAIQGLFKMCNIPFVGNDVLGSAIGMDKDVLKRLLREKNIATPKFLVFNRWEKFDFDAITTALGLPFFLKPANAGSSIGIHKVRNETDFEEAIKDAFKYDDKIILEEFIAGREIECAVLGDEEPVVSIMGEIIPHHEFYTYEAKYFDENGASVIVPANLSTEETKKFQAIALDAYKTLCCSGLARVDFFYGNNGKMYVNEINTIPGFTNISMYPKCWEASGLSYPQLVEKLILLGLKKRRIFGL